MKTLVGIVLVSVAMIATLIFSLVMFGLQLDNPDMTQMRLLLEFPYTWKWGVGILIGAVAGYALIKSDKR